MFTQSSPVIVKLIEPERELSGLADVLLGSLGIAGLLTLGAVMLGVALGALVFWLRSRSA